MTRPLALLLAAFLAPAGCTYNAQGSRVGDWFGTVSGPECEWVSPEILDAVADAWDARDDLPERGTVRNVEVCYAPASATGWQGLVSSSTRRHTILTVRRQRDVATEQRLIVHEICHATMSHAGMGLGYTHADPRVWEPAPDSVEATAIRALQGTP